MLNLIIVLKLESKGIYRFFKGNTPKEMFVNTKKTRRNYEYKMYLEKENKNTYVFLKEILIKS